MRQTQDFEIEKVSKLKTKYKKIVSIETPKISTLTRRRNVYT